jgi:Calcineurin-like phosphoesterase
MRCAHIADIHWRSLSRHDEYREVFDAFAEDCKKQEVEHIFIGGDLFHTKTTGISPEYIDIMTWWLNRLASVAQVHLILGNHDGNLVNASRQDAVSPIVNAIQNPNVHLYKQSGVYEFAPGFNFCVFSLFDREGWENVKPVQGMTNIACFHGPVWGAKTECGWAVEGDMTIEFFKDYDFCFLGDIHHLQFLDYREYELEIDEKDLFKYPGAEILEKL